MPNTKVRPILIYTENVPKLGSSNRKYTDMNLGGLDSWEIKDSKPCGDYFGWEWKMGEEKIYAKKLWACSRK